MTSWIILWLSSSILLYLTAVIVPGFTITSFGRAMLAALMIGLLNMTIRYVLVFLSLPFYLITFGLFVFVVNAAILRLAAGIMKGFDIKGWGPAILGAVVMTLLQISANYVFNF